MVTKAVGNKMLVWLFAKLFEDWLSNRDSWFLLKIQITIDGCIMIFIKTNKI